MSRNKKFYLHILAAALLAGGLFGIAWVSGVGAAPVGQPLQGLASDTPITPTETLVPTPTDTPTITPVPTDTLTPTDTPTSTATPSVTPIFTNTPVAPGHIVISQFRTRGPDGADDEFVELYNPTGAAVNISGWLIRNSSSCGTTVQTLVTISSGVVLQPGQHFLAAASGSGSSITDADQTFSPGIADDGGLALVNPGLGTIIDQVGMCTGTYYFEGNILQPLAGTSDQSYERKPGGNSSCYDTNNNAVDFSLISPANPHNLASPAVMCSGVALSSPTATFTITRTPTRTLTRTPTRAPTAIPGFVVLNEFLPHPHSDWNGDGSIDVGDEYIEIINLDSIPVSVYGWKLDTGANSSKTFSLPNITLQPRQIAFFFHSQTGISLSDGGGTVRLLKSGGYVADAFTYPVVELADQAWCRMPDGGALWGFVCRPSPGRPNILANAVTPGASAGASSICQQNTTIPPAMLLGECGSFGSGIANDPGESLFWLQSRWKWDVFLE